MTTRLALIVNLVLAPVACYPAELGYFVEVARDAGVTFAHHSSRTAQKYLPETMSGGVALFDFDGDGRLDIFLVNGAKLSDPMPQGKAADKTAPEFWNRLYQNLGDGSFADVTERAGVRGNGYGQGAAVGDFDNDGNTDLYVTNVSGNTLYRNLGDGRFVDVTTEAGVAGGGWSASAAFFDYDSDGDLDLFVARYLSWSFETNRWCGDESTKARAYCHPRYFKPISHLLYRNEGNGRFIDVSPEVGLEEAPGKGLGVALMDYDRDGRIDIVVANDKVPQQIFANRKQGFVENALLSGAAFDANGDSYSGMGAAAADYDNDGWPDLFIDALALQGYALYRNSEGFFEYISGQTGVAKSSERHSGWGAGLFDYDQDGRRDLFVAQGHVMDNIEETQPGILYREPYLLMRNGARGFEDVSAKAGPAFAQFHAGRGAAFGDLDNDGDIDVVVNNNDEPVSVLLNQVADGHWLLVDPRGTTSNRGGIGAQIKITPEGGPSQYALVTAAGSYMSSSDRRVHFGIGSSERIRLVEITWPSGIQQRIENVAADQILAVTEPAAGVGK